MCPATDRSKTQSLFIIRRRGRHDQKPRFVKACKFSLFIVLESALCWNP